MLDPVLVLLSPVPFPLPSHRHSSAGAPPLRNSATGRDGTGYESREVIGKDVNGGQHSPSLRIPLDLGNMIVRLEAGVGPFHSFPSTCMIL